MSKKVVNGILYDKLDDIESNLEDIVKEDEGDIEDPNEEMVVTGELSADNTLCDASVDEGSTVTPEIHSGVDIFSEIFENPQECPERESCISHTLQLVVKDALKGLASIEKAVEHVAKLIATASSSYLIKSRLELFNGFLGKRCQTRWNSEFLMIRGFLKFTADELDTICIDQPGVVLSVAQRGLLEELLLVLYGIYEATLCIQKEQFSIGHVLPLYRG